MAVNVETVVSVPFMENTYLVSVPGRTDCVVVDPGLEPDKILALLSRRGLVPALFLLTHGHADHIGGNAAMKQRWPDVPLVIGAGDEFMLADADANLSAPFGMPITSPPADRTVREGDKFQAAGIDFEVLEVPGHSPGHLTFSLPAERAVFSGCSQFASRWLAGQP